MNPQIFTTAYGQISGKDEVEIVNDLPVNTWLNEGSFVYRLQLSGGYRKGIPNVSNDFSFRIQPYYEMSTEEQATSIASHIADLLRQEDFRTTLCNLQAYGREFYIKHSVTGAYYARKHSWVSWEKDRDDSCVFITPCAIEILRALEDIQHEQLIDRSLLEIGMTEIPEGTINPVNVDGKPFVVLKSLTSKDVCITMCKKDQNVAILANGRLAYNVLAFCDSYDDAHPIWEKALYS